MHCTNAFCILSVHEVGYQTADQSGLMICARLCDMYDSNSRSQWTCTVLWHCKVNPCGVWHQCSLFLKYKHPGVAIIQASQFLWRSCEWANGKAIFCVVDVKWWLTAWRGDSSHWKKAPTSFHIWLHNIIWVHIHQHHMTYIHVIGMS